MPERPKATPSKKRGNRFGFAFFRASILFFGLRGAYGLLYFVCLYYVIFDRASYIATMSYIKRRFRTAGFIQKIFYVYKIFINQGKNLIDRYYIASGGRQFDCEVYGYDKLKTLLDSLDKGVILLTAHVGNWQVAMTALEKLGKNVYLLMRPEENRAVQEALNMCSSKEKIRIISSDSFLGGAVEVVNALNKGCIVSIMGDRTYGFSSEDTPFMGETVRFPYGAFSISAATGCPVVLLFSAKTAATKYFIDVSHVIEPPYENAKQKKDEIKNRVREFAMALEGFVERYPFQWFVFSDIWAI